MREYGLILQTFVQLKEITLNFRSTEHVGEKGEKKVKIGYDV